MVVVCSLLFKIWALIISSINKNKFIILILIIGSTFFFSAPFILNLSNFLIVLGTTFFCLRIIDISITLSWIFSSGTFSSFFSSSKPSILILSTFCILLRIIFFSLPLIWNLSFFTIFLRSTFSLPLIDYFFSVLIASISPPTVS